MFWIFWFWIFCIVPSFVSGARYWIILVFCEAEGVKWLGHIVKSRRSLLGDMTVLNYVIVDGENFFSPWRTLDDRCCFGHSLRWAENFLSSMGDFRYYPKLKENVFKLQTSLIIFCWSQNVNWLLWESSWIFKQNIQRRK